MRAGSLFAGVGGFDLAAERAGLEVVWQCEIDPKASAVLTHHWPGVKRFDDVHTISLKDGGLFERAADVDVLAGGFPCQDYSVAGNRGGLAGDRGALWWQFHRLIAEGRPRWVVGENVPGLLSSRGGRDFAVIIDSLTELGYGVTWAVLDAQWFGVAQRRRRVFIVGHSGGRPRPEVLALSEGVQGHPEPRRQARQDIAGTLAARTRGDGFPGSDDAANGLVVAVHATQAVGVDLFNQTLTGDQHVPLRTAGGHGAPAVLMRMREGKPGGGKGPLLSPGLSLTLAAETNDQILFTQNQRDEVRLLDIPGALAAEPGVKQQTYIVDPTVRRLTPLECERLQGFPDGWTDVPGNSYTQRYRQMGNAVCVNVAEWIMRRLAASDEGGLL